MWKSVVVSLAGLLLWASWLSGSLPEIIQVADLTSEEPAPFQGKVHFKTATGKVWFISDAPLETISAASDKLRGVVDSAASTFAFAVDILSFEGFNSALQHDHFNENYLESEKHPTATLTGKIIERIDYGRDGTFPVRAKGYLTIHGIRREIIIPCKVTISGKLLTVHSEFSIILEDFGIKIPRIVHEKISPDVIIHVDAKLVPASL